MPDEILRNCHSDIRLNMSCFTLAQLSYMLSFSVKFLRLVEGENSSEYKTAVHWKDTLSEALMVSESSLNSDSSKSVDFIMHSYFE